jgi:hypothetical protein
MLMRARKFAGRARSFAKRKVGFALRGEKELRLARQKINEKNVRLSKLREQMGKRDREITRLRAELGGTRSTGDVPVVTQASIPVFFIVGFAKSGTSWLMRTLNYHPEILCTGEGLFFGRGTDLDKRRGTVAPSSLYGVFADSEYLRAWLQKSAWTRGDDVEEHVTNLAHGAMDYVFRNKLAKTGKKSKRIVGDKTPFVTDRCIEEINLIYPEARVIHIIRDGRDVAVSAVHHMWNYAIDAGGHLTVKPEEVATRDAYRENPVAFRATGRSIFDENRLRNGFAKSWFEMTAKAIEDGPSLLGENYVEVRYEDLLMSPEEEVGRLLRFLGADDSKETVRRCIEKASFESWTKGRERGQEESTAFLRKGVAGDWKNVFTGRDKEIFKEVTGDLLIRLGYEKDGDW